MTFPDTGGEADLDAIVRQEAIIPLDEAPAFLRAEAERRAAALRAYTASAPDVAAQLVEVDVDRVIHLVGTSETALRMIAAAIVELDATARSIADVVGWMEMRPVAMDPAQQYQGIDIAYIVAFRALTKAQRWLLQTLAIWAPPPATISRDYALTVAANSGALHNLTVTAEDLDRLVALALVDPADLPPEAPDSAVIRSLATTQRVALDPYVRHIAASGLANAAPIPDLPEEVAHLATPEIVAATFANWAVHFAEVIAGPTIPTVAPDLEADEDEADDDDDEPGLTPDPALEALTDDEAWAALEPETPHIALAASIARELAAPEYVYRLCQLLAPLLRRKLNPLSRPLLQDLLETGLICARAAAATSETLLLATQLADMAVIDQDWPRAEAFANEALDAALAKKDMRAIGFATRRVAAIAIRQRHAERAVAAARQAVALAKANGTQEELVESVRLLDLATRLGQG